MFSLNFFRFIFVTGVIASFLIALIGTLNTPSDTDFSNSVLPYTFQYFWFEAWFFSSLVAIAILATFIYVFAVILKVSRLISKKLFHIFLR